VLVTYITCRAAPPPPNPRAELFSLVDDPKIEDYLLIDGDWKERVLTILTVRYGTAL